MPERKAKKASGGKSTPPHQSLEGTKPRLKALEDAFSIVSQLKEDNFQAGRLRFLMNKMGVALNDKEFEEVLLKSGVAKDGIVNFNTFMATLGKMHRFTELTVLKDAIEALDRVEGDKVLVHELPAFLRKMGIQLSDPEFQQTLKKVSVDGAGKVVAKDFVKVLTNVPLFSDLLVLKDTIKAISCIHGGKISLQDLKPTLTKMGIHLTPQEYEEIIQMTPTDREGELDIGQVMNKIKKTQRFRDMEVLNNSIKVFNQFKDNKVKPSDVKACLSNIGVHFTETELAEVTKSLKFSPEGTVDIKELMSAVKGAKRFANCIAVHDTIRSLKLVKQCKEVKSRQRKATLDTLGLRMANQVVAHVLKLAHVTDAGQAKFNDFMRTLTKNQKFRTSADLLDAFAILEKVKSGRIGVEDLKVVMKNFNIDLPAEEISEALAFCTIDDQQTVNLKEFIKGVTHTSTFLVSPELQLTCLVLSKLKDEHFDLLSLEDSMDAMDLPEAKELLQEVMKTAKVNQQGKVNFKEFMRVFLVLPEVPKEPVLKETFSAMSTIKDNRIHVDEMATTLANLGIHLTPHEVQELQNSVKVAGDRTVDFKDVVTKLTGTQSFAEFNAVQGTFSAINKICKEKIKKEDLPAALADLGISLSPEELKAAMSSAAVNESGMLDGTELLKILADAPRFTEFVALQDAINVVENIKHKNMTLQQLKQTLENMGVCLTKSAFEALVSTAKVDENGEINFKDFLLALGETAEFTELEALQRAMIMIGTTHGSHLHLNELESTLDKVGLHLTQEEVQEVLRNVPVAADGTVNVKDFLMSLAQMPRFMNSKALRSATEVFSRLKGEKVKVSELNPIMESLDISLSDKEFEDALKNVTVDKDRKVNFRDFLISVMENERFSESTAIHHAYGVLNKMQDNKIEVSELEDALGAMDITLTKEEMREALDHVTVDDDGKVDMKKFMSGLPNTRRFSKLAEMEGAVEAMKRIRQDKVDVKELESIMGRMGIQLSPAEVQEALKFVTKNDDGTVSVKTFMSGLSKNQQSLQDEKDGKVDATMKSEKGTKPLSSAEGAPRSVVAVEHVNSLLSNIGIDLTKEELETTLKHLSVNEKGKVNVTELMNYVLLTHTKPQSERDRIHTDSLEAFLISKGISLTSDEIQEALRCTAIHEDGTVDLTEFMKGVKTVQQAADAKGKMVAADDLSPALAKMGIHLTKEEMEEVLKHVTLDAEGKVNLKNVLESVMALRRPSMFEKDRIRVQDLEGILASAGIHLTAEELQEALKYAPVDVEGKVNLGKLMKGAKAVQPHLTTGEMVAADDLSPTLAKMGIHLTKKEMEEALKHVTPDAAGKVNLKNVLESVVATRQPVMFEKDRIRVQDLGGILASAGIHLTAEELQEALKYAPVDAEGKVNLGEFMKGVRAVQSQPRTGEMVAADALGPALAQMGIHLTKEEMEKALKNVTPDAAGKVNLKNVLESVVATRQPAMFEKDRIRVQDLGGILASAGIHLTAEELQEALKYAPVDAEGKVNLAEFMKGVKAVQPHPRTGKMVVADDLSPALAKMGIHLTKEEMEEALKHVTPDAEGKVNLKNVLESVVATRQPAMFEKDRIRVQDLGGILASAGIHLTAEEFQEALKYAPVDAEGKVNLGEFMKGVRAVQSQPRTGKMVVADDLSPALAKMGIHLTKEEMEEALKHVTPDAAGKVNLKNVLESVVATRQPAMFEKDRIRVQDLGGILASAGIHLTAEELQEALKYAPVDAEGKVNLGEFMKGVRAVQSQPRTGKMVAAGDLSPALAQMGIHLTKEEMEQALKHVTPDATGQMNLKNVLESVMATRQPAMFEKDRVRVQDLGGILASAGIHLTAEELQEALKYAPVDAEGKVNLGEFMKGVRAVQPHPRTGKMVAADDLGPALAKMGIHLTKEEMEEALKHVTPEAEGKVNLKNVLESVMATRSPAMFEKDRVRVQDLEGILASAGIHLTAKELQEALKYAPVDAKGKVNLAEFMKGAKAVQLRPRTVEGKADLGKGMKGAKAIQPQPKTGKVVTADDLSPALAKMGIHLTKGEMEEALKHVTLDAEGKVNMKSVLERVMATRQPAMFEKDRVHVQDLGGILAVMGIHLTAEELQEALKYATVDAEGKVNLGEFMKRVKAVQPQTRTGEMVAADDLNPALAKMGIHLTEEEMEEVLKHVTPDAEGKVNLKSILENVTATRQPSMFEKDRVHVQDLGGILASAGIQLTAEELREALKYAPVNVEGKVNLGEFMKGVRAVQPQTRTGKMVAAGDLSPALAKMGIHLTKEEMEEVLKHVTLDAEGKVNLKSVLESVMATRQTTMFEKDRVHVQDLEGILASMGIHLTAEELQEALKYAPVDGEGKVNLAEFMKGVRAVQPQTRTAKAKMGLDDLKGVKGDVLKFPRIKRDGWMKASKVDVDSLDAVLTEMGIHLTKKQVHEALKHTPVAADGKVDLEAFKRGVRAVMKAEKRVAASKLQSVLAGIGIDLTQEEVEQALKVATVNEDGTVNLKDFLWAAQAIPSIQNKKVKIGNLNSVLAALGICLTQKELQEALKLTRLNEDGTANLSDLIRACNATLTLSSTRTRYLSQKPDLKFLKLPKVMEKKHSQSLGRVLSSMSTSEKTKFKTAKTLTNPQLEAFHTAYDAFCKDIEGKIDLAALEATAKNLGVNLTEEEAFEELVYADMDGDGKVNFTDFLDIVTNSKRFVQAVAPKEGSMETVDARGILFFELLSKLVETSALPGKATTAIVSYYRQKFLESTGKKAWNIDEKKLRWGRKGGPAQKNESSSLAAFAGAGRIVVMKDNQLEAFVRNLQATTTPSDSPYSQIPIFPLIPNRDCVMAGKPKKDTHKLEALRRTEPVTSFEDHFFNKRRWLPETKSPKSTRPSLSLAPELMSRGRRLTIHNLDEIRREVKKATENYRKALALRERNKSLKLWRRLRGGEIGLETGNPSFYQTFSTYSWSWNICKELLTPQELQEYDNQLYHSLSRSGSPADRMIKADGKQRGSRK